MKNYYFTFGQNHCLTDGYSMCDHWVRVRAKDYTRARELFVKEFSSLYMPAVDKWAFQYEEEGFKKDYFPKGEYQFIADIRGDQNKIEWWGYEHISGTLQAKPYYNSLDITEAESSSFVAQVVYPFLATDREDALKFIEQQVKN
jgi:hypothetical protein